MWALLTLITHRVILGGVRFYPGGQREEAGITGGCEWLTWLMRNKLCVLCERGSINLWDSARKLSSALVSSTNEAGLEETFDRFMIRWKYFKLLVCG